jgi:hypothetical protein
MFLLCQLKVLSAENRGVVLIETVLSANIAENKTGLGIFTPIKLRPITANYICTAVKINNKKPCLQYSVDRTYETLLNCRAKSFIFNWIWRNGIGFRAFRYFKQVCLWRKTKRWETESIHGEAESNIVQMLPRFRAPLLMVSH